MPIALDHTIVWTTDRERGARFLADLLGVPVGAPTEPFLPITLDNGVTLDYATATKPIRPQHYAFRVDDAAFDAALARLRAAGATFWADPGHERRGRTNTMNGGRGCYVADPDGHNLELLTRSTIA